MCRTGERKKKREETALESPALTAPLSKAIGDGLSTTRSTKLFLYQMPSLVPNAVGTVDKRQRAYKHVGLTPHTVPGGLCMLTLVRREAQLLGDRSLKNRLKRSSNIASTNR